MELTYQRKSGQWLQVQATNHAGGIDLGLSEAELRYIATSLVDRERPVVDVIRLRAALPGYKLKSIRAAAEVLRPCSAPRSRQAAVTRPRSSTRLA
jgi:hypothetical protein